MCESSNISFVASNVFPDHVALIIKLQSMFRFVTILAFLASVAAFAPMGRVASSSMKMAFAQGLPGADGLVDMNRRTSMHAFPSAHYLPVSL